MTNGWTDERRKRQAERIRQQKPWEKSTGPKSAKGKAASSQNALKHGLYGADAETIKALLKSNREFVKLYKSFCMRQILLEQTDRLYNEIKPLTPSPPENQGTK